MSIKSDEAVNNYCNGFNCCQSVVCSYCNEGNLRKEDVFKLCEGLGGGIGGLGDTCGAALGMFMAISFRNSTGDMSDP